jgi:xanthine dehydrogenase accessory factor
MNRISDLVHEVSVNAAAVLATVVGTRGSVPREGGARMVIGRQGSIGTVGGGNLEWRVMAEAQALLRDPSDDFRLRTFALGPELGQCCGGSVTVAIETFTEKRLDHLRELEGAAATEASLDGTSTGLQRRVEKTHITHLESAIIEDGRLLETFAPKRRQIHLFGAGHVGRAVASALSALPFEIVWIDERRDAFPATVAENVTLLPTVNPAAFCGSAADGSFALVMTHSHGLDLDIVHAALVSGRYAHVGLIGSATKRARFVSRLRALGLGGEKASDFKCPIGIDGIRSKEPAAIAASVAAECLILHERLSAGVVEGEKQLNRRSLRG